ncbi:urea ABC transporter permease subunit UrtB [Undibacter mobilis]|uniref:Urea ABC transporter permease subunit UrtB n=1 Tax=Undibacter mobilis TaxID=2292256 RepID=A0A371BCD5_9BRAD|nr:urea ABC transporter permease subunit UrtB [Undibacter mobilis]RDV05083.1 urea ABC transporter permease subunit UrtB [Undibacter mobilis]
MPGVVINMRGLFDRIAVLILFAVLIVVGASGAATSALAGPYEEALPGFVADSFSDTATAIDQAAASGSALAAPLLQALKDQRLQFSAAEKKVLIKAPDGKFIDAATGQPFAGTVPADLSNVRLNNRLRNVLDAALGSLTLMAADPNKRYDAAQSVFKSRDAATLPALEKALAAEQNARVKAAMMQAKAAIAIISADAPAADKIAAIAVVRDRGDQDAMALLQTIPANAPPDVLAAVTEAKANIERNLALWATVQNLWYGLSLGSVLLLAAIGLAITFGVMGVINMAHGEMVMLGAYTTFVVQEVIRTRYPGLFDYSLTIALPLAFIVSGTVGIAIERSVIRFLYGRPLETLLATWGISLVLQQAVRAAFGPTNKEVGNPSWMSGAFDFGGILITYNRLWIIVFTGIVFVALLGMLRFTRLGLEMRAVTQNRSMAAAVGIRTARIDALTFGLGSGIAGIAGVALSQIDNVSPNLGQGYIIDSFMVVVFGGVGNLWGTLVGALTLGIANKFLEPFAGAVLAKIAILVFIILFIQKRPRGMFALKGRAIEA